MEARKILSEASKQGIKVSVSRGHLLVEPASLLTPRLEQMLRQHKQTIFHTMYDRSWSGSRR